MSEREGVYPPGPHGCLHSAQSWYIKDGVMGCDDCDGDRSAESARRREVEQARDAVIACARKWAGARLTSPVGYTKGTDNALASAIDALVKLEAGR